MSRFRSLALAFTLLEFASGCAGCDKASAKPAPVGAAPTGDMSRADSVDAASNPIGVSKGASAFRAVPSDALCATSGALLLKREGANGDGAKSDGAKSDGPKRDRWFAIESPSFRAVSSIASRRAELAFVYLGATTTTRALGSGAIRRQLGLKLEARNPCNLVYAMWRLRETGDGELVVQWKHNADQTTSAQCGNRGYETIRARKSTALPNVGVGTGHLLRSEIEGEILRVFADDALSWEGVLPREALASNGVVGLRSDNVRFEGELRVSDGDVVPCSAHSAGAADEEPAE